MRLGSTAKSLEKIMQPESAPQSKAASGEPDNTECPNCHALLPRGLRFCRACGYRLGEGLEEYVETVRLNPRVGAKARPGPATDPVASAKTSPFQPQSRADLSPQVVGGAAWKPLNCGVKRRKAGWMVWMIVAIIGLSVAGGGLMTPFALRKKFIAGTHATASRSYAGVDSFESEGGGASLNYVLAPGTPADKAGLVGGDVITSFDGQPVKNGDDIMRLLKNTPVGKTVEVVYIRDGQSRTTQMTTISKDEVDRLTSAFKNRPEGIGYIGEGSDIDRVIVPGMNIYGVRLNEISKNRPADMAGIEDGDVVVEFDGVPTRTRRELERRIERAIPYSTVKAVVIRNGQRIEIPVKIGKDD